jgi:hypothetical protein
MKAKKRIVALAVLAVLIPAVWAAVRAADKPGGSVVQPTFTAEQRDTLRGLQGVRVIVEELKPEVERLGLMPEALQTDTELQLRQYGIKVLSKGDSWLYVRVSVADPGNDTSPLLAVSIDVSFKQCVYLARDPAIWCTATTWQTAGVARVGRGRLAGVRDYVKDQVAEFINDYLAVNPKEGKVKEEASESKP